MDQGLINILWNGSQEIYSAMKIMDNSVQQNLSIFCNQQFILLNLQLACESKTWVSSMVTCEVCQYISFVIIKMNALPGCMQSFVWVAYMSQFVCSFCTVISGLHHNKHRQIETYQQLKQEPAVITLVIIFQCQITKFKKFIKEFTVFILCIGQWLILKLCHIVPRSPRMVTPTNGPLLQEMH